MKPRLVPTEIAPILAATLASALCAADYHVDSHSGNDVNGTQRKKDNGGIIFRTSGHRIPSRRGRSRRHASTHAHRVPQLARTPV